MRSLFHFGKLFYLVGQILFAHFVSLFQVIRPVRILVKRVVRGFVPYPHAGQCEAGKADGQADDADQ